MSGKHGHIQDEWQRAKQRCRLSAEALRMAQEMGLNPKSLIKNIPSPSQRWKLLVEDWVREMYGKRQEKAARKKARKAKPSERDLVPIGRQGDVDVGNFPSTDHVDEADSLAGSNHLPDGEEGDEWEDSCDRPSERAIAEQEQCLQKRWRDFQITVEFVAAAFSKLPFVEKVVLFGSVAQPLTREVPRFAEFRRYNVALPHECKDVDLAVWVSDLNSLKALFKARNAALNTLREKTGLTPAHHQIDVFLLEPGTNRYLGRLCAFNSCPRDKSECQIPGCGKFRLLKQYANFALDWDTIEHYRVLYEGKEDKNQSDG
ncbi:MAG: hypothetical protein WC975_00545 [Phycisphaerae bacterium]